MKTIGRWSLAAAALAAAAGVSAWGRQQEQKPENGREAPDARRADVIRLGEISGMPVRTHDGRAELGTVEDVIVDFQKGRAPAAVIAPTEHKGKFVGVAIQKLRVMRGEEGKEIKALTLEGPEVFSDAPAVTEEEWERDDRAVLGRLAGQEDGASLIRASAMGKPGVFDAQGERLGEVDAVMVNIQNARLLALVGVGGVLGVGERRHVVPWEILRVRERGEADEPPVSFTLTVPRTTLEKGPVLGKDEENRLSDPSWVAGLYQHYQYGPLGAERGSFRAATASKLIGAGVHALQKPDEEIAEIHGLAIVAHSGKVAYAAVEHDGKYYAVPMEAFKIKAEGDDFTVHLDATAETFKGKQGFDDERWPAHADKSWTGESPADGKMDPPREGVSMILKSSEVMDADVKDSRRVTFGEIEDLAVDLDSAHIVLASVGSGGFLGIGETYYAVPWKVLRWAGDKDKFFTVNADRKTLERSVEFDEDRLNDPGYIRSAYSVYGLEFEPMKAGEPKKEMPPAQP